MGLGSQVPVKELVIDGLRVAYREQGAGSPLVLLHVGDAIPGAELVVIEGVGHMVDLQAPRRCNAALRDFLRRVEVA